VLRSIAAGVSLSLAAAALTATAAAGTAVRHADGSGAITAEILMPGTPSASVGGFYAAVGSSVAKSEHLRLKLTNAGPGVFDTIPQIASGVAPFSLTDSGFVLTARSQGIRAIQIFAPYNSPVCVMFHPSENIHSFADLSGHTIAVTPGAPWWLWVQAKYHPTNINVVNYSYTIAPWISDANMVQQCFITNEPFVAKQQGVPVQTLLVSKSGFNLYDDVLFTTASEIAQHPDVVAAVVKAVAAGWVSYWAHPGPTNAYLRTLGDTESAAQMAYEHQVLYAIRTTPVGFAAPTRMKQAADQMYSIAAISKQIDQNWQRSFTNAYLPQS
jgi:NitT/TauT family transport system substrate-binding protein